jgi:CheY-like chemotaxis protein
MANSILIVEDEAIVRKNLSYFLDSEGYETHEASNGLQAIELIKKHQFDLVITDLLMPELDGLELIQRVQAQSRQTRIIVFTAYLSAKSADARLPGPVELLAKPIELDVLLSTVRRLLANPRDKLLY